MRSSWLVAAVIVALAAAGWAFHLLSAGEPQGSRAPAAAESRSRPAPRETVPVKPRDAEPEDGPPVAGPTVERDSAPVEMDASGGHEEPLAETPEPPRPSSERAVEPAVDLDQARADFRELLDELDGYASEGRHLDNTDWVALYKRGNDALAPLRQNLRLDVPAEADELREAQAQLREKLHAVAPRPADTP